MSRRTCCFVFLLSLSIPLLAAAEASPAVPSLTWQAWGEPLGDTGLLEGSRVTWMGLDPQDWIWVAGEGRLAVLEPLGPRTLLDARQGVPEAEVRQMAFHPSSPTAYLATDRGLFRLDGLACRFEEVKERAGPSKAPLAVAMDGEGSLYVACPKRQLSVRSPEGRWRSLSETGRNVRILRSTPDGRILAVAPGAAWLIGAEGTVRWDLGTRAEPRDALGLIDGGALVLVADGVIRLPPGAGSPGQRIWKAGADDEPSSLALVEEPLPREGDPQAVGEEATTQQVLWVGTRGQGLLRILGGAVDARIAASPEGLAGDEVVRLEAAPRGGALVATAKALQTVRSGLQAEAPFPQALTDFARVWRWEEPLIRTVRAPLPRTHYQYLQAGYLLLSPEGEYDPTRHRVRLTRDVWQNRELELTAPMHALLLASSVGSIPPGVAQTRMDWSNPSSFPPGVPPELEPFTASDADRRVATAARVRLDEASWASMTLATRALLQERFALRAAATAPHPDRPARTPLEVLEDGGDPPERTALAVSLLRGLGIPTRLLMSSAGRVWGEAWCSNTGWRPFQAGTPVTAVGSPYRTSFPAAIQEDLLTAAYLAREQEMPRILDASGRPAVEEPDVEPWDALARPSVLVLIPTTEMDPPQGQRFPLSPWLTLYAHRDEKDWIRLVIREELFGQEIFRIPIRRWDMGLQIQVPGAFTMKFIPTEMDDLVVLRMLEFTYVVEPPKPGTAVGVGESMPRRPGQR